MRLYHTTTEGAARQILAEGFREAGGQYLTSRHLTGVWLADRPLDANAFGKVGCGAILVVDLPGAVVSEYEAAEPEKGYREFLVPAAVANSAGRPWLLTAEAIEEARAERKAREPTGNGAADSEQRCYAFSIAFPGSVADVEPSRKTWRRCSRPEK